MFETSKGLGGQRIDLAAAELGIVAGIVPTCWAPFLAALNAGRFDR